VKAKIWVKEICTPYYSLLMQISVTRYELLADVFFLSSILLAQTLFILKENLIFVLKIMEEGSGVNSIFFKTPFI
jgi:hypothetical protein